MQDVYVLYTNSGMDLHCGTRIFRELRSLGITSMKAEGRMRIVQGGSHEASFHKRTYTQLKPKILAFGRITSQEYEEFLALYENPSFTYQSRLTVSTWGCCPAKE